MLRPVTLPRVLPYLVDAAIAKTALLALNQRGANCLNFGGGFLVPKLPFSDQLANHLAFVTVMSRCNRRLDPPILLIGYRYTFLDHWHGLPSRGVGEFYLLSSI